MSSNPLIDFFKFTDKEVFYKRPEPLTSAQITKELEIRESTDAAMAEVRGLVLDEMFPNRPKRETPETQFTNLDDLLN